MRVILCDDHPLFRDGLRLLLGDLGIDVVGDAATGEEAITLAAEARPDVIVMDLKMPGISGVDATRRIIAADPAANILVLTMIDDDVTVFAALRAGARGYLLKGAGRAEVERALRAVARGDALLSAPVAAKLRHGMGSVRSEHFAALSAREVEVLELVARGRSNEQISTALFLSVKTVRNNVSAIMRKLDAASRAELVSRARDGGLGAPDGRRRPP